MDEKRTIIDTLWSSARIYVDEQDKMLIRTVNNYDDISENCLDCKGTTTEVYVREDTLSSFGLIVLKCERCGAFNAFWIQPVTYEPFFEKPSKEDETMGGRLMEPQHWKHAGKHQWSEGKRPRFPKKVSEAYKKSIFQHENQSRKISEVINKRLKEMYEAGLSIETINAAKNKATIYMINHSVTQKQAVALLAASMYEVTHEKRDPPYTQSKQIITERQLEKIFGVTRKTIRKWTKKVRWGKF